MTQTAHGVSALHQRRLSLPATLREAPAGRLFATYWGSVLVVDLARPVGGALTLMGLGGLVVACSVHQRVRVGVALGVVAWLFATGFLANQEGELVLHGPTDVVRLALLVCVAALAALVTSPGRGRR